MDSNYQSTPGSEYTCFISDSNSLCERNKQQALRFFKHDFSIYEEMVAVDIRIHGPATGQETVGIEEAMRLDTGYATAYPNAQYKIHDIVAGSDKVVVRWSMEGTQTGERCGLRISGRTQSLPSTNQEVVVNGIHIYRFNHEGKIVESWAMWDRLGEIEQIADISITAKCSSK